jgi:membrane protease YdiL (CAAX protease family)
VLLFFLPSACIISFSLVLLLTLKTIFKHALPSYGNIMLYHLVFVVFCAGVYAEGFLARNFHYSATVWLERSLAPFSLVLFAKLFFDGVTLKDVGLCLPSPKKITATIVVFSILSTVTWLAVHYLSPRQKFSKDTFLYMLLISGVSEELVFRGLMPSLLQVPAGPIDQFEKLNKFLVFAAPTAVFSLIHAWRFVGDRSIFSSHTFYMVAAGACAFMYLRLKTGSLLNSMIVHNVVNAGTVVVLAIS